VKYISKSKLKLEDENCTKEVKKILEAERTKNKGKEAFYKYVFKLSRGYGYQHYYNEYYNWDNIIGGTGTGGSGAVEEEEEYIETLKDYASNHQDYGKGYTQMQRDIESWRIISKVILKIYKSDRLLFNNIRAVYIKKSELNYRLEKEKSSGCLGVIILIIIPIIIFFT